MLENEKSAIKSRVRDNFSVTSIFIVTAIFSVTENSSRAEFDNRLFSFQQPLRFAALSTSPYTGEAFTRELLVCIIGPIYCKFVILSLCVITTCLGET